MNYSHYESDKSLLLQLRDAAKVEYNELTRFQLRDVADQLDKAMQLFKAYSNGDNLEFVNGLWAKAVSVLKNATGIDPAPGGAKMRVAA